MKRFTLSGLMALLVSLLSSSMIFGAGFQIPEQGVASMGMGMAGIGKADDLAAIYHNPAGLATQKGTNLYVDVAGIGPRATYTRPGFAGEDNKSDLIPVPLMAVASDFGGRLDQIIVAFAVNAPFGLRNEYDATGPQRYLSTNISLATAYVGPYVGWQLSPQLAVGAGVQYVYATAEIEQRINYGGALNPALNENQAYDGNLLIDNASDHGVAANIGLLWKPTEQVQLGLSWHSGIDLNIDGDATLTIPAAVTQISGGLMQSLSTQGQTTVSLPQTLGAGVAFQPLSALTIVADVNWINWSVYKNIDFTFDQNTPYFPDKENPRDWEDSIALRLGAEYLVTEQIALRAGYLFDQSPIPTDSLGPELPTGDRNGITFGAGYQWERFAVDVAYAHLFIEDRTVTETIRDPEPFGDYESSANIFGASLAFKF